MAALKMRLLVDQMKFGLKKKLLNRVQFNQDVREQKLSLAELKRLNTIQKQDYLNIMSEETHGLAEYLQSVDAKLEQKQNDVQDQLWELQDFETGWKKQHEEIKARLQYNIDTHGVPDKCLRNFISYNIKHLMHGSSSAKNNKPIDECSKCSQGVCCPDHKLKRDKDVVNR